MQDKNEVPTPGGVVDRGVGGVFTQTSGRCNDDAPLALKSSDCTWPSTCSEVPSTCALQHTTHAAHTAPIKSPGVHLATQAKAHLRESQHHHRPKSNLLRQVLLKIPSSKCKRKTQCARLNHNGTTKIKRLLPNLQIDSCNIIS